MCDCQIYKFSLFSCSWDWNGVFFYSFFAICILCFSYQLNELFCVGSEQLFHWLLAVNDFSNACALDPRKKIHFRFREKETFQGLSPKQKSSFDRNLLIYDFPSASLVIFKLDYFRNQLVRFIAMSVTHGQTHDVKIHSTIPHCRATSRRWWHAMDVV